MHIYIAALRSSPLRSENDTGKPQMFQRDTKANLTKGCIIKICRIRGFKFSDFSHVNSRMME